MPELPEVETVAKQLDEVLPGRTINCVEVIREKSAQTDLQLLSEKTISQVGRRAKMVVIEFDDWDHVLLVHLKMTGQLIFDEKFQISNTKFQTNLKSQITNSKRIVGGHPTSDWVNTLPSSHTRIIIRFVDGSVLYFNDMRVFGWMKVVRSEKFKVQSEKLPPDVIDEAFTVQYLVEQLARSSRAVKLVILDQQKMGGMGNIYANDALWKAQIHPCKGANSLSLAELTALHQTMREVLGRGILLGGASESTYKHINGMGGRYQEEFLIYKREGQVCLRNGCGGVIEKLKLGGRGTYFCPVCQQL
jgi:formamidopyrimidine-DNA glycosylase